MAHCLMQVHLFNPDANASVAIPRGLLVEDEVWALPDDPCLRNRCFQILATKSDLVKPFRVGRRCFREHAEYLINEPQPIKVSQWLAFDCITNDEQIFFNEFLFRSN